MPRSATVASCTWALTNSLSPALICRGRRRHHRATANQIEIPIGDRFVVSLKIEHAPLIRRGRSEAGTQQLLIVVVPLLEMMWGEEHPLVPHDFTIPAHMQLSFRTWNRKDFVLWGMFSQRTV